MPNGGSDNCGTCWFNAKNKGEAGHAHLRDPEPSFCSIRNLPVEYSLYTYCSNHPHRRPERDRIPIGPVFTGALSGGRELWQASPDTEEIRQHLLSLLDAQQQQPSSEYPAGMYADEVVVWQPGEFREVRGIAGLRRIANFDPSVREMGPFGRTRQTLVKMAREAIAKIEGVPA
jgi:hypothetical protein